MQCRVLKPFSRRGEIVPAGGMIEIPEDMLPQLAGRVTPLHVPPPDAGRNLPHYCPAGNCWCSEKLPGKNFPAGCAQFKCEHHHGGTT